jgi:iron complex transport system substrate-binding protein
VFRKRAQRKKIKREAGFLREIEEIAAAVVDCGYHLHREIGPGLLESVYVSVLAQRLTRLGFHVETQKPIPAEIDGIAFGDAFRADLLVNGKLILEIKSTEKLAPLHIKQLLTYLRLMQLPLGLLMNFGGDRYSENVKRVMNNITRR